MRDYVIIALVLASLPLALFSPYLGLLAYAWVSYMYPQMLAWSFARSFPVAQFAGIGFILGFLIHRPGTKSVIWMRENVILILLLAMFALSSAFAFYPTIAWTKWMDMAKIILVAILTSIILTDITKVKYFLMVVALSIGFWGLKGGIFGFLTAGEFTVWGPGSSIMGANNAIGLALNMALPMLWYLARGEQRRWLKMFLQAVFFLSIPAIMFTYSRASVLGLAGVLVFIIVRSRQRIVLLFLVVALGYAALPLLPERWIDRQKTTVEYQYDLSALSRLEEWRFCWRVAVDRPLTGGGFGLYSVETYGKYYPEFIVFLRKYWSAHSIYFAMLAEHGFIGLGLFLTMIAICFYGTHVIKRQARGRPELERLEDFGNMIQASLIGFLINGAFVEMQYFDLVYHLPAVVASLRFIAHTFVEAEARKPMELSCDVQPVLAS